MTRPAKLSPYKQKPGGSFGGVAPAGITLLQVVIETPRGSRNKYSFDEEHKTYALKTVLPAGMCFPLDFGFVPGTCGGDGDPLDALVFLDEPAFPGCTLLAHLLGVMLTEQVVDGETQRNDRLIAVADATQMYRAMRALEDIPETQRAQLAQFFVNYHRLQGKTSRLLSWGGPDEAHALIEQGIHKAGEA